MSSQGKNLGLAQDSTPIVGCVQIGAQPGPSIKKVKPPEFRLSDSAMRHRLTYLENADP